MRKTTIMAMTLLATVALPALAAPPAPVYDERPAQVEEPRDVREFDRRVVDNPMRDGVKLAVADINRTGGILGRQVQLIAYDYKGDQLEAVNVTKRMIGDGVIDPT